jgi:hypothetical protein
LINSQPNATKTARISRFIFSPLQKIVDILSAPLAQEFLCRWIAPDRHVFSLIPFSSFPASA